MKKLTIIIAFLITANMLSAQWIQQNPYYPNSGTLNDIFFIDQDHGWAVGNSLYLTANGGYSWDNLGLGNVLMNSIYFTDQNKGWAVGNYGEIRHTVDGGENWENQELGTYYFDFQSVFFVDSLKGWIAGLWVSMATTNLIILHTDDGGITWVEQASNWGNGTALNDIFFVNDTTGWAIGECGNNGIIFTNDGGNIWQYINYGNGTSIYFKDEYNGWYTGDNIYHTSDGGATWEQQLGDTTVWNLLNDVVFIDLLKGWVVGDNGTIFHTCDGGENWEYQESGTTIDLYSVSFVDQEKGWICGDSTIILHTNNGGVVGLNEISERQNGLSIYPNPSREISTITFELKEKEDVTLSICNINGQEIKYVPLGLKKIGNYELNCSVFSPGIYFITLQTESGILTEKLIIE